MEPHALASSNDSGWHFARMFPAGSVEAGAEGGVLETEIRILRQAMGELVAALGQAGTLDEKARLTQALSLVGKRLA